MQKIREKCTNRKTYQTNIIVSCMKSEDQSWEYKQRQNKGLEFFLASCCFI